MFQLMIRLSPYLRPYWRRVCGALLFSLALALLKGAQAYLVKPIFDQGLGQSAPFQEALTLTLLLLALSLLNFPLRFYHFYWIRWVVDQATCQIRSHIYGKLQKMPMSFYSASKQGKLLSCLLSDTLVFSTGFRGMIDLVREPVTALVLFCLALYRDWQLTLVVIFVSPFFLLIFGKSGRLVRKNQGLVQGEFSEMTHLLNEGLSGQKMAKSYNLQKYVLDRFARAQNRYFQAQMKTSIVEELAHPLVELVGACAFCGVILFAHQRISSGTMTTGDFVSFITALALLMDPIRKYSQANVRLNQARAASERIFQLLDGPEEENTGTTNITTFQDKIVIRDLSFSYGDSNVISHFNLEIPKGVKLALVGLSGSGKSTLINLLLGLYPIKHGSITIDGTPVGQITLNSLRNLFALVSQDIFLFHDTVKENLTLGRDISEEQIAQALDISYSSNFVSDLPHKTSTILGDRGTRLSGGQQQRITIARAFLKQAPILLLDEATSALDNESEQLVQAALEKLGGNSTVIAIAHRLSTIQNYDCIVVMKEGTVVERGTHGELLALGGEYYKLYQLSSPPSST